MNIRFETRCRPFTGEGVRKHEILVDTDEQLVRVYDPVAGHYTLCHSLSERTQRRLLVAAAVISVRCEGAP